MVWGGGEEGMVQTSRRKERKTCRCVRESLGEKSERDE